MAANTPPVGSLPPASTPTPIADATALPAENVSPTTNTPQGGAKAPVAVIPVPIPPNKPNEPAFQLKIEPDTRLEFKSDKLTEEPCQIEVKLTNPTKDRQTFKVKCTSNDIFRVRPPLGFCDAEASTPIKITFSSKTVPDSGRHYFAFYHMKSNELTGRKRPLVLLSFLFVSRIFESRIDGCISVLDHYFISERKDCPTSLDTSIKV
ncbi:unnamed protein product [Brugia timori]|uniref:Major sperm protein n=1 Tax=Brugia timori TaxID=42155 RepID=A0A0R3QB60_9BILA|nr:unnamed protein product [Brugia timori]